MSSENPNRPSHADYRAFWGKAQPATDGQQGFHGVAWHSADVTACFLELLDSWPDRVSAIEGCFESVDGVREALAYLVALHDIGKFARTFQAKAPEYFPEVLGTYRPLPAGRHDTIGYAMSEKHAPLMELVRSVLGENEFVRGPILSAIFGHHGRPIEQESFLDTHIRQIELDAAADFAIDFYKIVGNPILPKIKRKQEIQLSWILAGLTTVADWIGSNQQHFPYEGPEYGLSDYWKECARPRAKEALRASGLIPASVSSIQGLRTFLPDGVEPSAAQKWAAAVDIGSNAGMFLIEDVMGSGKTEAAIILAQRLMQSGQAGGVYIALPTMATANNLYRRAATFYRKLYSENSNPSLILAHGARMLDSRFVNSIGLGEYETIADVQPDDEASSSSCARWIADDRRRAFLADIGVGTIDQAILCALPVKHACVRQIGLSRRVLIIDEAHAYDAYMQQEIAGLVEFQARLSAPVIILSATLPKAIRNRLIDAHSKGRGGPKKVLSQEAAYPLATAVGDEVDETPLGCRPDLNRSVTITRASSPEEAEHRIADAAENGAACCYIRNTVDDAIATYCRMKAQGLDVTLFHARFAMGDRLAVEEAIVTRFGKAGGPSERRSGILIATQVVEQSIDLDFDLMATDLAPVDLILQRMGRMWRHQRGARPVSRPELLLVSPDPDGVISHNWVGSMFPKGQYVYQNHALLWKSARQLLGRGRVETPGDVRTMVEASYEEDSFFPPNLTASFDKSMSKDISYRGIARNNLLNFGNGYVPGSGAWQSDTKISTRISDGRETLRLCKWDDGHLKPWIDDPEPARAWALSEISVTSRRRIVRQPLTPEIDAACGKLEEGWAKRYVFAIAAVVQPNSAPPAGGVAYGTHFGLVFEADSPLAGDGPCYALSVRRESSLQ